MSATVEMTRRQPVSAPPQRPGPRRWGPRNRERIYQWLFLVPAVAYLAMFFGYPVAKNVAMGFQDYSTATFYTGEAPWVGLQNYVSVVASSLFTTALVNTALFT